MLIQDGAKYHTSAAMQRFFIRHRARLTVSQLPSYSPDYHPIEKLWKKVKKEGTHLRYFPTFEALTDKVEQALLKFANTREEILSLCSLPTELARAALVPRMPCLPHTHGFGRVASLTVIHAPVVGAVNL